MACCGWRSLRLLRLYRGAVRGTFVGRYSALASFGYYLLVRVFVLVLIFFGFSLWVMAAKKKNVSWLAWIDERVGLVVTSTIIGLVQIFFLMAVFLHKRQRTGFRLGHATGRGAAMFLRLVYFEWIVLNFTSLFVTLSSLGLPEVTNFAWNITYGICLGSAVIQYILFIRYYVRRKPLRYWRFKHCFLIMLPIGILFGVSTIVFMAKVIAFPVETLLRNWLIASILVTLVTLVGVPFTLYRFLVIPIQRRMLSRHMDAGPTDSVMEIAIRKHCLGKREKREEIESILLIGLNAESISGLDRAKNLRRLYLACNHLKTCKGLEGLTLLESLSLDDNDIAGFLGLMPLTSLDNLRRLTLERNPICTLEEYDPRAVIALLPQLHFFNGLSVSDDMRRDCAEQYKDWKATITMAYRHATFKSRVDNESPILVSHLLQRRLGARGLLPVVPSDPMEAVRQELANIRAEQAGRVHLERWCDAHAVDRVAWGSLTTALQPPRPVTFGQGQDDDRSPSISQPRLSRRTVLYETMGSRWEEDAAASAASAGNDDDNDSDDDDDDDDGRESHIPVPSPRPPSLEM